MICKHEYFATQQKCVNYGSLSGCFLCEKMLTVCFVFVSPLHFPPCSAPLIHFTCLGKGIPTEANSNMHLPNDPWPWADKVTSTDFYNHFCHHASLLFSLPEIVRKKKIVVKKKKSSGQTCCSDALQAQADKNIKIMTAKHERWTETAKDAGEIGGQKVTGHYNSLIKGKYSLASWGIFKKFSWGIKMPKISSTI